MYQENDRIYFNQNLIYHKDNLYNSGGVFEVGITTSTTDYKNFSAPSLQISIIGEDNRRKMCNLNFPDTVDLYSSLKDIVQNSENIFNTTRHNTLLKKYQYDKTLKFELIQIQGSGDRIVTVTINHNPTDFGRVIIPYYIFCSLSIGLVKYFVNNYIDITISFSTRNLITELLEQNKMIKNGISILPSSILNTTASTILLENEKSNINIEMEKTLDDFDKFLGKDMENIKVEELNDKKITEGKNPSDNVEVDSPLVFKTLNKDLYVLESMINSAVTRPDPMVALLQGFRRSMNLSDDFSFLPDVPEKDLKSLLYISKLYHDIYVNMYLSEKSKIPSAFPILKYDVLDKNKIEYFNLQLAYDLLLIFGFIKIFRSKIESKEPDALKNGSLFYMGLRLFLDPLVYSFLDKQNSSIISNVICSNFTKFNSFGFFKHYQEILSDYNFSEINSNDINNFCNELRNKVLSSNVLDFNINDRHEELFKNGFLRINSDNNLKIEQIINELIPLQVFEMTGNELTKEKKEVFQKEHSISDEVWNIFSQTKKETKREKETNIFRTVKFYNDEVPVSFREEFFKEIDNLQFNNFDFNDNKFNIEELGENILKALYVWNESENKQEPYTDYRNKIEENLLTKELIIVKYKNEEPKFEESKSEEEWDLDFSVE
jgi:hypothetical protein